MSSRLSGKLNKALTIILLIAILGAIGGIIYLVRVGEGETFTGFYVLNVAGKAYDYPVEMAVGEKETVMLGIANQEGEAATYAVEIRIDGVKTEELEPIYIENGNRWERVVSFEAMKPGAQQKVEFLLYKDAQAAVYEDVYLWIDVTE